MPLTRRARSAAIAVVALAIGSALLAVLLRYALDGGSLRSTAEARLSAMLGQPVTIGAMDVDLFPRAAVVGTAITIGRNAETTAPALDIARIEIRPRLRTLLRGPVVIRELRLDGLVVSVLRDRTGGWHVPAAMPAPTAGTAGGVVIDRVRVTRGRVVVIDEAEGGAAALEASSIDDIDAEVVVAPGGLDFSPVSGQIGGARISGRARLDAVAAHLEFSA